jgi:hypothetical protein
MKFNFFHLSLLEYFLLFLGISVCVLIARFIFWLASFGPWAVSGLVGIGLLAYFIHSLDTHGGPHEH